MQVMPFSNPDQVLVTLQAEPEPLEIDLQRTAVIVVDFQNAFASKGGNFDLRGMGISCQQKIIEPVKEIISVARVKGCKIVYTLHLCVVNCCQSAKWDTF